MYHNYFYLSTNEAFPSAPTLLGELLHEFYHEVVAQCLIFRMMLLFATKKDITSINLYQIRHTI